MSAAQEIIQHVEPTAVVIPQGDAVLSMIERASRDPNVDIVKFERLMDMQERVQAASARRAFNAAVAEAKGQIGPIARNATGHNEKRYADFSAIARVVDPVLAQHGLSYRFRTAQTDRIQVTCILAHQDGHCEESTLSGPPDKTGSKNDIQAIGSTLSYLQRYSLVQSLGLSVANDDDGKASGSGQTVTAEQADTIRKALEFSGADEGRFLAHIKLASIEDILASKFDACMQLIKSRRKSGETK